MSGLQFVGYVAPSDLDLGPIVALRLVDGRLYASTQYDGGLGVWDVQGGLAQTDSTIHLRGNHAGVTPDLGVVADLRGDPQLITGGGAQGDLRLIDLRSDGAFGRNTSLGQVAAWAGDLEHSITVDLGDAQMVYGAKSGAAGLGWLRFEDGALVASGAIPDTQYSHAEDAQGMAALVVGGQRYVVSLGGRDPGLTAWRVTQSGALEAAAHLAVDEGLWISAPSGLAAASIGGRSFVVVAAAVSGSLSVVEVLDTGRMVVIDHVLDDRTTRFGGVEAVSVIEHHGQPWIIAGGADDGISVFMMLPGGKLLAQAHMAQDLQAHLADVSAIAACSDAEGLHVYVSSFHSNGITELRLETGPQGAQMQALDTGGPLAGSAGADVLKGGAGEDRISAGAGDDVLIDGAGRDTLTGGYGADTFVLSADGQTDVIADFAFGEDRMDLSGWAGLRHISQLDIRSRVDGFEVRFDDERVVVRTTGDEAVDLDALTQADLIATLRILPTLYVSADVPPTGGDLTGTPQVDRLYGTDAGQNIFALDGNDQLFGGAGRDWLFGGAGKDRLDGGGGRNLLDGGLQNDTYVLRSDLDQIDGEVGFSLGGGIDTVEAWMDYVLPSNIEILRLQGEADLDGYGNAAPEVLVGNPGDNLLSGGWGEDRIVGKAGDDVIIGGPRPDELVGDAGRDTFVYAAVTDSRAGRESRDFINGFERGQDLIDLSLIDANTRTAENDAFTFLGNRAFSGTWGASAGELIYAEYGGNWNIISGDVDGDGAADFQIFVNLTHWMTGTDFIL